MIIFNSFRNMFAFNTPRATVSRGRFSLGIFRSFPRNTLPLTNGLSHAFRSFSTNHEQKNQSLMALRKRKVSAFENKDGELVAGVLHPDALSALKKCPDLLTHVDQVAFMLKEAKLADIADSIPDSSDIKSLCIKSDLTELSTGIPQLSNLLGKIGNQLKSFKFSNTPLKSSSEVDQVISPLLKSDSIESISLEGALIGDNKVQPISDFIEKTRTLKELNLANNRLTNASLAAMAKSLRINSSIEKIYAYSNRSLGRSDLSNLMIFLEKESCPQFLCLSECSFSSVEIDAIRKSLSSSHPLRHLRLQYNNFGVEEVASIKQLLEGDHALEVLDISNNFLNTNNLLDILESLCAKRAPIKTLKITDNPYNRILIERSETFKFLNKEVEIIW